MPFFGTWASVAFGAGVGRRGRETGKACRRGRESWCAGGEGRERTVLGLSGEEEVMGRRVERGERAEREISGRRRVGGRGTYTLWVQTRMVGQHRDLAMRGGFAMPIRPSSAFSYRYGQDRDERTSIEEHKAGRWWLGMWGRVRGREGKERQRAREGLGKGRYL